ncbi:unnamed protein product [Auanema sp. JU1783]|nr:unnamed protein product [Auanema sp. JU1783]
MVWKTIFLLLFTVASAVMPGFAMLTYFKSIFPSTDSITSIMYVPIYLFQAIFIMVIGFACLMIYADFMFPLVMHIFGRIFSKAGLQSEKEDKKTVTAKPIRKKNI